MIGGFTSWLVGWLAGWASRLPKGNALRTTFKIRYRMVIMLMTRRTVYSYPLPSYHLHYFYLGACSSGGGSTSTYLPIYVGGFLWSTRRCPVAGTRRRYSRHRHLGGNGAMHTYIYGAWEFYFMSNFLFLDMSIDEIVDIYIYIRDMTCIYCTRFAPI